jgi:ribonuclease BN (tRNA processing enzyme)
MRAALGDRLRLTVLGCSTAAPHPVTPTAGFLVEWADTSLLLDVGQGVIRNLQQFMDPTGLTGVVVGHMHADHFLDVVGLRYLFPWGERAERPLPVHLPPGGRERLDALSRAISERDGFFDASFDAIEYDPASTIEVGDLRVRFVRGRHYVPAWGVVVEAPDGARIGYTGDTGPSDSVAAGMHGVDLLLVEAALHDLRYDDPERGHLTGPEALELARTADVGKAMLVHYGPAQQPALAAMCAESGIDATVALDGLTLTVDPRVATPVATDRPAVAGPR